MKLRTRLIISFCIIIFVPVLLAGATIWGFGEFQMRTVRQAYNIDGGAYEYLTNSIKVLSHFTKADYEALQKVAKEEPEKLEEQAYLEKINQELAGKYSYLIVRKEDNIIYGKDINPEVSEKLPEYANESAESASGIYIEGEAQVLLKQIDFTYSDDSEGTAFIVTSMEKIVPEVKKMVIDMGISVILILIFTGGMLTIWIYRGIINPIRKLQGAAQNIKAGNLDFTIEAEGNDEIGELCRNFEDMRLRLKESAEEKIASEKESKVLISNISHDLKTPITAIKGYVEGIIDGVADTPEKQDKYIRTIYNKANEMDTLINELTLYSKIDANKIPYNFKRINVADYFNDCVEEVGVELEAENIKLTYIDYVDADVQIIADPEQLRRVINNIISNSVKYLDKRQGFINIRIRDVGDFIQVELEDNGKGIAAKDLPYIFDRFYRTDASRNSATGGSGIGLSIVRKIIEDHGGKIWANSKEGSGTIMYFVIRKYQEVIN
ncbi:sensor histidine kinase [Roseburia sp. 499]|uniref:sensor histidine kinase n=1 Tax=Roseburia sp. 499 TaxID=1261634 RepID=UPI0009521B8F|nr:HAMP domain-containing sensor histidine kinase [Roseburia sp. 499]WVK69351.1 HAMP domain-containing sensor histidine kinase [Roseburia sp. 499]